MNGKKAADLILPFHTLQTLRFRIGWFINLRWLAIFGILSAIPLGQRLLQFQLAYDRIYLLAALLIILNLIYFFWVKYFPFQTFRQELTFTEIQLVIDLLILSFLIHYAGGISNVFYFSYTIHIIISGILFQGALPYYNALLAALLLTVWCLLEHFRLVSFYSLTNEPVSLSVMLTSLLAFYILIFAITYVVKDFMVRFRELKKIIDQKSRLLEITMEDRDKMFRFTAHELKSPLTTLRSVLSVIDKLYQENKHAEVRDMVDRAARRTDQLLNMVKDMIEITQQKNRIKDMVIEQVGLDEWLDRVIESQRDYAINKDIRIVRKSLRTKPKVRMDVASMNKVAENLIHNAIRYSPTGATVTVETYLTKQGYGFRVIDTGIGIEPDDLQRIFEEFYRGKNARKMEQLGTGLGLCLVKQIVEQFGGRIAATSQLGIGSTFTVEMPYQVGIQPPEV